MQIGDPKYKKCPVCGFLNEYYPGPYFFNYYGFHEWSDGYTFSEQPSFRKTKLQRCDSCKDFFWCSTRGRQLTLDDQIDALNYYKAKYQKNRLTGWLFRKKSFFYIRINLWKEFNHHFRIFPNYTANTIKEQFSGNREEMYIENVKALIDMVNSGSKIDLIHKAELYRNIGYFENATNLLHKIHEPKFVDAKAKMLDAIKERNKNVILLVNPNR